MGEQVIRGAGIIAEMSRQRGALIGWAPVCLGLGIAVYFDADTEPARRIVFACLAIGTLGLIFAPLARGFGWTITAAALIVLGFGLAGWRADSLAAPVLGWRYYGPVEGRIAIIDRSSRDRVRLTLDEVRLSRVPPRKVPDRVRVSLPEGAGAARFAPGDAVMMTAHLSPPGGPVEPGGFDFQRMAWFLQLGAVGYTRAPVLLSARARPGDTSLIIANIRRAVSDHVTSRIAGPPGAFAAAILTGDRSAMDQDSLTVLRRSNLAHLLAISGLHMGLLTAFVFATLRSGAALVPWIALRWPNKKIAAGVALVVGAGYLALSGGNVATQRAFIMVAVMLVAVIVGRRALTLRSVAIAALIVLFLRPEALAGPGFQMSFAATTALVVVFGAMRGRDAQWLPRWLRPVAAVVLSSLVAGLATAPFAAAHFNQIAHYGLLANVLSVPLMGVMIMPSAVLALVLYPLGLDWIGLELMALGLRWVLGVANFVADLEGSVSHVRSPAAGVLPLMALSLLWLALWRGIGRGAGLLPLAVAFWLWSGTERPALLISESGGLIGRLTPEGRVLSKPRGDGFVASGWLENDGAPVSQETAFDRGGLWQDGKLTYADLGAFSLLHVAGARALAAIDGCGGADMVITTVTPDAPLPCNALDPVSLRATGSIALYDGIMPRTVTAREIAGRRLWNTEDIRTQRLR